VNPDNAATGNRNGIGVRMVMRCPAAPDRRLIQQNFADIRTNPPSPARSEEQSFLRRLLRSAQQSHGLHTMLSIGFPRGVH
jgi:hypothetical protein